MKIFRYYYLLILVKFIGISNVCFSQKTDLNFGFQFVKPRTTQTNLHFKMHSNLVVISAFLENDTDSLNFILDTGASQIYITDPKIAQKYNFNYSRTFQISGAGEKKAILAHLSIGHNLKFNNILGSNLNFVVLEEDILNLSDYLEMPIHGIIGYQFFNAFAIEFLWQSQELKIWKPEKFNSLRNNKYKFPISLVSNKPYFSDFTIENKFGNFQPLNLLIDTGAGQALLVNDNSGKILKPSKKMRANLGQGLNGTLFGDLGKIANGKLGKTSIKNIVAAFPDSTSFDSKFPPNEDFRDGSIGLEILRRFYMVINYHEKYIILKPISEKINEPFEVDKSGLELNFDIENRQLLVRNILENSPASVAGIQKGDQIIYINNIKAASLKISEIQKMLSNSKTKKVELIVSRNKKLFIVNFKLVDLL